MVCLCLLVVSLCKCSACSAQKCMLMLADSPPTKLAKIQQCDLLDQIIYNHYPTNVTSFQTPTGAKPACGTNNLFSRSSVGFWPLKKNDETCQLGLLCVVNVVIDLAFQISHRIARSLLTLTSKSEHEGQSRKPI